MRPVFPTKTFVNHFSIATGLYPGNHGVLANAVYDTEMGLLKYSYDLFHYNESTIPIWTANEMAGKTSGCWWPGSDYEYNGVSCMFTRSFNGSVPFEERVDTVIKWVTHEKTPANLVMMYFEEPDQTSHPYGPDSIQVTNAVASVDRVTQYIEETLMANNLQNRVNVIFLSDHGMVGVPISNIIDLTLFLATDICKMYGTSPVLQIVPNDPSDESEIFTNLTRAAEQNGHFNVYNQYDLPARWNANNARRMGPILAVAEVGYAFQDLLIDFKIYEKNLNVPITNQSIYGVHGYDNEEPLMNAFFMAKGPIFGKDEQIETIDMIDLYNLFCLILKIECYSNDGSNNSSIWNALFVP
ncbi:ectonucleotide pyrophosphatase/phosphodiesterase family member 5-like isoform X2 [Contarinia nasturtii]|nr:ectonucleotide pyrophosphatase/phosphodiesterase family member 5-like isoform X2 [Contarinia nasturtii]XP_031625465.1 ectonucleotide pyrophosphatase/phosphodiesterase family member 5-like isoform X2 [Contarinia nasturtii]